MPRKLPQLTAIYARVSKRDGQQTNRNQLRQLRAYAKRAGYKVREYIDRGTAADLGRPQYVELLAAARRREFERVLVWRFDRMARSTVELILRLEEFQKIGIEFVSLSEGIDTSTAVGEAMFAVAAVFAQFERRINIERSAAGVERAKADGKRCHRPRVDLPLDLIRQLDKEGHDAQEIADRINVGRKKQVTRWTVRRRIAEMKRPKTPPAGKTKEPTK